MLKIALIGAGGFIGSEIAKYFSAKMYLVKYTKSRVGYSRKEYQSIDIGVDDFLKTELSHLHDCDFIYYLIGGKFRGIYTLEEQESRSVPELNRLLDEIKTINGRKPKIVFMSSGGTVYGSSNCVATEDSAINPFGSYGKIKILLEKVLVDRSESCGYQYVICRLSNPYGLGQLLGNAHGFISQSLKNIKNGLPVIIPKDCEVYRDYMFIDDLMIILDKIMDIKLVGVFNVCTGKSMSINSVVKIFQEEVSRSFQIIHSYNSETVKYNFLSNYKLLNSIGLMEFITVESGVRLMVRQLNINEDNYSLHK